MELSQSKRKNKKSKRKTKKNNANCCYKEDTISFATLFLKLLLSDESHIAVSDKCVKPSVHLLTWFDSWTNKCLTYETRGTELCVGLQDETVQEAL